MSIICKTGCGQQVVYENIEFTDGFAYQCPHNLDNSLHYCPIFYSDSSLWWIIAASNNIHDAPFALKEGTIIRIPIDKNTILNNFYE